MEYASPSEATLVLLVDADPGTRGWVRPMLLAHGLDVIQARSSLAALELLQRMPERFRLVIVSLEMRDLPGAVVLETLRLFRSGLTTLCVTAAERVTASGTSGPCLSRSARGDDLEHQIVDALSGRTTASAGTATAEATARATAAFATSANLLEAARELARGMLDEAADQW